MVGEKCFVLENVNISSKSAVLAANAVRELLKSRFRVVKARSAGETVSIKFTDAELLIYSANSVVLSCPRGGFQVVVLGGAAVIVACNGLQVRLQFEQVFELQKFYALGDVSFLVE